jgi:hypothetical protein
MNTNITPQRGNKKPARRKRHFSSSMEGSPQENIMYDIYCILEEVVRLVKYNCFWTPYK